MIRTLTLLLALLIAVTSQQMAVARGMLKNAQGQVILCTGQGVVTVTLDAQGQPLGPVHICPDCALTFMAAVAAPATAPTPVVHMRRLSQTAPVVWEIALIPMDASARGPPVLA